MITKREQLLREIESRILVSQGINLVRNPSVPPSPEDMPYIALYELTDMVTATEGTTHGIIVQKKELTLVIEYYYKGVSNDSVIYDFSESYPQITSALLRNPDGYSMCTLKDLCHKIVEKGATKIFRPVPGQPVVGIGLTFVVEYTETI